MKYGIIFLILIIQYNVCFSQEKVSKSNSVKLSRAKSYGEGEKKVNNKESKTSTKTKKEDKPTETKANKPDGEIQIKTSKTRKESKADGAFQNKTYYEAITQYEKILKKDPKNIDIKGKVGLTYYKLNQYKQAFPFFNEFFENENAKKELEYIKAYAVILQSKGDYTEAIKKYQSYTELNDSTDFFVEKQLLACKWAIENPLGNKKNKVTPSAINVDRQSFGVQYYKDQVVFSTILDKHILGTEDINPVTGKPYLDLYYMDLTENDRNASSPKIFSENLLSPYNEGTVCFTKNDSTIYFTRNFSTNTNNLKNHLGKDKYNKLSIYSSDLKKSGEWSFPKELSINDIDYSSAHPTLSEKDDIIVFSSDREGGYGGKDLYYTIKTDNGWTSPVNMGETINTVGDEVFPYIDANNTMYFSSNARNGYGGLDVYSSVVDFDKVKFSEPVNMLKPINTSYDDFAYVVKKDNVHGFLSSNRNDYADEVYHFYRVADTLSINILDSNGLQPLAGVSVKIFYDNEEMYTGTTNDLGEFIQVFNVPASASQIVNVIIDNPGYYKVQDTIEQSELDSTLYFVLASQQFCSKFINHLTDEPIVEAEVLLMNDEIIIGKGITNEEGEVCFPLTGNLTDGSFVVVTKDGYDEYRASVNEGDLLDGTIKMKQEIKDKVTITFNNILFDYNSAEIRTDAAEVLDRVYGMLIENPHISIFLSAHSDSRGGNAYNKKLSDKRAKSAVKYLVKKGIVKKRLQAKGYGEEQLKNKCSDGVKCSDEEHQVNRRIEIKIIE